MPCCMWCAAAVYGILCQLVISCASRATRQRSLVTMYFAANVCRCVGAFRHHHGPDVRALQSRVLSRHVAYPGFQNRLSCFSRAWRGCQVVPALLPCGKHIVFLGVYGVVLLVLPGTLKWQWEPPVHTRSVSFVCCCFGIALGCQREECASCCLHGTTDVLVSGSWQGGRCLG